jgi:hypothetical protein
MDIKDTRKQGGQSMKRERWYVGLVAATVLLVILACSFSASTANIEDAYMARDYDGEEPTTTFAQEEVFYCIVELGNAPDDTMVKASWTAVNVEGAEPDTFIDETELTTGSGSLRFELSNDNLWPRGQYKVDLYLNGELDRTLEFEVQ